MKYTGYLRWGVALVFGVVGVGAEPLRVGDKAPSFELPSHRGAVVRSADLFGKTPVVIYFYPKDDTPGCTRQACGLRDDYEAWRALSVPVFGVSFDSIESHRAFAEKHHLPFDLLSDVEKRLAKAFGIATDASPVPPRVTFVIGVDGRIAYVNDKVNPLTHSAEVRAVVQKLIEQAEDPAK